MKKIIFILTIFLSVFTFSNTCLGQIKVYTEDEQSLIKNTSTQIKDIKIVEDETNPQITGSWIRIVIPDDLQIIWDTKYTSIMVFWPAVTNNKIDQICNVTYEKQWKIMIIPIKKAFSSWDEVTLSQLYVKTFGSYSDSKYLWIAVTPDNKIIASVNKYIYIPNNDRLDNNEPWIPTNLKLEQISQTWVRLSWTDPYDLDLQNIEIYKWINNELIWSNKYANIEKWKQYFEDNNIKIWDKVKYILKATDGRNYSLTTEELSLTLINFPSSSSSWVINTNSWIIINNTNSWIIITDSNNNIQIITKLELQKFTFVSKYSKTLISFVSAMDKYISRKTQSNYTLEKLNQITKVRNQIVDVCNNIDKAKDKEEINSILIILKQKVIELKNLFN